MECSFSVFDETNAAGNENARARESLLPSLFRKKRLGAGLGRLAQLWEKRVPHLRYAGGVIAQTSENRERLTTSMSCSIFMFSLFILFTTSSRDWIMNLNYGFPTKVISSMSLIFSSWPVGYVVQGSRPYQTHNIQIYGIIFEMWWWLGNCDGCVVMQKMTWKRVFYEWREESQDAKCGGIFGFWEFQWFLQGYQVLKHRIGANLGKGKENCLTLGCVMETEYSMKKWMKLKVVLHRCNGIIPIKNGIMKGNEWIEEERLLLRTKLTLKDYKRQLQL